MIVYRHIRLDKNEVFYIGIGKTENRAYEKRGRNNYWKNIIKQTEYKVDILFDDLTWEEACEKEKEFIQLYGRNDLGLGTLVNMTDGGDGTYGVIDSLETRLKKSNYAKNNNPMRNLDSRKKVSLSKIGKSRPDLSIKNKDADYKKLISNGFQKFLNSVDGEKYKKEISIRVSGENNPSKRLDVRKKNSESQIKFQKSLSSDERLRRTFISINKPIVCEHCNLQMNVGNYARWHGEKCKNKIRNYE